MNKIEFKTNLINGEEITKEIKRISDEDIGNYKSLGKAGGADYKMCLFMAHRKCKNFGKRVVGFRSNSTGTEIEFFEKE